MGDNYYNNNPPYGQPRPNSASQQYIPPGAQQQQGGYNPANYGGPPPSERYSPYRAGDGYGGAQQGYNTYQPPRDDGYRPPPHNQQVGPYRDDYDDRRRHEHHRHSRDGGYLGPSAGAYGDKPSSRRSSRSGDKEHGHKAEKSVGATLLGGAVGAFAGHEIGHGGLSTLLGAAAGAYGGHELEKRREKKKAEQGRRDGDYRGYADGRRRSRSRHRSHSRKRDDSTSSSGSDDSRRRRPNRVHYN